MLAFGPESDLYIATGDGGSANDPGNRAQSLETLLGKLLRIDVDAEPVAGHPYAVPPDNPFVGVPQALPEIFAYGLRNPWRFSIDRVSGMIYTGDVGQNDREEVDVARAGGNYGWRVMEGRQCTPGIGRNCRQSGPKPPLLDYPRSQGSSITGGYVYRETSAPSLCGVYLYADFGIGRIWGLRYDGAGLGSRREIAKTDLRIASFGEDDAGELYVVDYSGRLFRIESRTE